MNQLAMHVYKRANNTLGLQVIKESYRKGHLIRTLINYPLLQTGQRGQYVSFENPEAFSCREKEKIKKNLVMLNTLTFKPELS